MKQLRTFFEDNSMTAAPLSWEAMGKNDETDFQLRRPRKPLFLEVFLGPSSQLGRGGEGTVACRKHGQSGLGWVGVGQR